MNVLVNLKFWKRIFIIGGVINVLELIFVLVILEVVFCFFLKYKVIIIIVGVYMKVLFIFKGKYLKFIGVNVFENLL